MGDDDARRYIVGYALQPEKASSVIRPSLVTHAKGHSIDLIPVDLRKPLEEQGPFDCLIHKLYTPEWKRQLIEFKSKYPHTVIIDPLEAIERLHNRVSMLEVVQNLQLPQWDNTDRVVTFGVPKQVVIVDIDEVDSVSMTMPVIAKPLLANGSDKCHEMCLVFNSDGLKKVQPPVVLQEFVNHGGVVFKVYVAGNHVKCVKRSSLPDVSEQQLAEESCGIMSFSKISLLDASDQQQEHEPPSEFIRSLAKALGEATGLHLFNFDLIRDARAPESRYLIIDINYFPGYAKVPGFETLLTGFFRDVLALNNKSSDAADEDASAVDLCAP